MQFGTSQQGNGSQQYGDSIHIVGSCDPIVLGCFGEYNRCISIQPDGSVVAGCFHGTFTEFKDRVVKKYGLDFGSYAPAIKILEVLINGWSEIWTKQEELT